MNVSSKRVLITGGSSGIGLALAHALLGTGAQVVIKGRRVNTLAKAVQELEQTGSPVYRVTADLAMPAGHPKKSPT
jgi:short-subunit dehydrogenase involved in D-alanine esterification of teichoic acids